MFKSLNKTQPCNFLGYDVRNRYNAIYVLATLLCDDVQKTKHVKNFFIGQVLNSDFVDWPERNDFVYK